MKLAAVPLSLSPFFLERANAKRKTSSPKNPTEVERSHFRFWFRYSKTLFEIRARKKNKDPFIVQVHDS
jgi:hypothetical protein